MVPLDAAIVPQVQIHADAIPAAQSPVRAIPVIAETHVVVARPGSRADWQTVLVAEWVTAVRLDATMDAIPDVAAVQAALSEVAACCQDEANSEVILADLATSPFTGIADFRLPVDAVTAAEWLVSQGATDSAAVAANLVAETADVCVWVAD